jgi:predicted ArsR family transcriptional regulator
MEGTGHESCQAQLSKSRAETRAAFENRALMYYHLFEEMSAELGRTKATEVMKRAIRRRGLEVGQKYRPAAESGDLDEVARIFCEGSPCAGTLFSPGVEERSEGRVVLRMTTCPLVDAWSDAGLSAEEIDTLCEIAAAVDEGTFEGAGLDLTFLERQPQPGGSRCLLELKVREAE